MEYKRLFPRWMGWMHDLIQQDTLSCVYQKWKHQYENEDISTLNHHVALHLLEDTFDLPSSLISFFLSSVVSSIASGDGNRLLTEADYKECVCHTVGEP